MFATPRNYIASILAGENTVKELHAAARRAARSGWPAGYIALPAARHEADARGRRLGVRNDCARSGRRGHGRPAHSVGRFRPAARST